MKSFLSYLRSRAPAIVFGAAALGIVYSVYTLYDLPPQPRDYALRLIAFAAALALFFDVRAYRGFLRRRRRMTEIAGAGEYGALRTYAADDALVSGLASALCSRIEHDREARELEQEYFTMWLHQVKNPIAAIKLILQDDGDAEQIEAAFLQVEHYIEMAINYQRMSRPSKDLVFRSVDLRRIADEEIDRLRPLIEAKKLAVHSRIAASDPDRFAVSDAKWLSFVVAQLLINAVKYTYEGGITVRTERIERSDPARPGLFSALVIEDSGIGIAPEDLPQLFQWGYTGNNGRIDKRSTGIGLYLCRRILRMLGHDISISSVQDAGTRVVVYLTKL